MSFVFCGKKIEFCVNFAFCGIKFAPCKAPSLAEGVWGWVFWEFCPFSLWVKFEFCLNFAFCEVKFEFCVNFDFRALLCFRGVNVVLWGVGGDLLSLSLSLVC